MTGVHSRYSAVRGGPSALLSVLGLDDGRAADWPLLLQAGNPPGNIRIAEGVVVPDTHHPVFTRKAIIERVPEFVEYAYQRGGTVTGSSGAQGDAPEFLLTQDVQGRWHADGVLADESAKRHWLVKYPRGRRASDSNILRLEALYMRVARDFGLRVAAFTVWATTAGRRAGGLGPRLEGCSGAAPGR